ncbi:MAG TPA: hypothetical protein VNN10_04425 [Dehalococcoidia bacterium]|nr:hypothetical protein [Dehalococcoidia bacterium]
MLQIPRHPALAPASAQHARRLRTRTHSAPAARLGFRRYLVACLGIATTAAGLALIVSALALMADRRPTAEASAIDPEPVVYFQLVSAGSAPDVDLALLASEDAPLAEATEEAARAAPPEDAVREAREAAAVAKVLEAIALLAADAVDADQARSLHALGLPAPPAAPLAEAPQTPPAGPAPAAEPVGSSPPPPAALAVAEIERIFPGIQVLRSISNVNVTFYDCAGQGFCGNMANGRKVYQGAAACSYDLPFGTRFFIEGDPTGRIYRCEDRGLLANTWVDIFWYHPSDGWRWQEAVGRLATIHIIEWGE